MTMPTTEITSTEIWKLLHQVMDPEVPVLSLVDLGVIREVKLQENGVWKVVMTPTYTGCPAMNVMVRDTQNKLKEEGIPAHVVTVLSPAWTTKWMTEEGKQKLKDYGIAPPLDDEGDPFALFGRSPEVICPKCNSNHTVLTSQFGSTACKSLYTCKDCLEPFEYFKCHK